MRTEPPQLLPLFRSAGQARLLARLYLGSTAPATISDLARELGLDDGGLTREADRLEKAGLLVSERIGRSRVLRPNRDSPYYADLLGLLTKAFGPAIMIAPLLATIDGVEQAFIYGSWAARYEGRPGSDPVDVDVLIVGSARQLELARIARELTLSSVGTSTSSQSRAPSGRRPRRASSATSSGDRSSRSSSRRRRRGKPWVRPVGESEIKSVIKAGTMREVEPDASHRGV
ncbi:MAG: winged helix-turn-helix domain-containing protein [Gaiellales bacterium]